MLILFYIIYKAVARCSAVRAFCLLGVFQFSIDHKIHKRNDYPLYTSGYTYRITDRINVKSIYIYIYKYTHAHISFRFFSFYRKMFCFDEKCLESNIFCFIILFLSTTFLQSFLTYNLLSPSTNNCFSMYVHTHTFVDLHIYVCVCVSIYYIIWFQCVNTWFAMAAKGITAVIMVTMNTRHTAVIWVTMVTEFSCWVVTTVIYPG